MTRTRTSQRRVISVGNLQHTCSRIEVNIVRVALERYGRETRDPHFRRLGRELLDLWAFGQVPKKAQAAEAFAEAPAAKAPEERPASDDRPVDANDETLWPQR